MRSWIQKIRFQLGRWNETIAKTALRYDVSWSLRGLNLRPHGANEYRKAMWRGCRIVPKHFKQSFARQQFPRVLAHESQEPEFEWTAPNFTTAAPALVIGNVDNKIAGTDCFDLIGSELGQSPRGILNAQYEPGKLVAPGITRE